MASPSSPQSTRKIFNCIVEDKALVAGSRSSTRNSLRQWVKNGLIRLFVPLHALEYLNTLKNTPGESEQTIDDIQETLDWLDEATTKYPRSIVLQGGDETFENWSEVKKFAAPRTMFSEDDNIEDEAGDDNDDDDGATNVETAEESTPQESTTLTANTATTGDAAAHATTRPRAGVPENLRPLFNYVLWRIHQEIDPAAAMETFIFLCNDPWKAACIRDFRVRCKKLEQLRDAIAREDREFKTQRRSSQSTSSVASPEATASSTTTPRSPPTAPAAMLKSQSNVIDPDAFDRSMTLTSPSSPQAGRARHQSQRSRGGSMRGRGRGMDGSLKPAFVDMLYAAGQGSRGNALLRSGPEIDPNSFERPRGGSGGVGGAGHTGRGGRKLWTPG